MKLKAKHIHEVEQYEDLEHKYESSNRESLESDDLNDDYEEEEHSGVYNSLACNRDEFDCGAGWCVPRFWLCDGRLDCLHGEDEEPSACAIASQDAIQAETETDEPTPTIHCLGGEFECVTGLCIPRSWLCDGSIDCPGGDDEGDGCQDIQGVHSQNIVPDTTTSLDNDDTELQNILSTTTTVIPETTSITSKTSSFGKDDESIKTKNRKPGNNNKNIMTNKKLTKNRNKSLKNTEINLNRINENFDINTNKNTDTTGDAALSEIDVSVEVEVDGTSYFNPKTIRPTTEYQPKISKENKYLHEKNPSLITETTPIVDEPVTQKYNLTRKNSNSKTEIIGSISTIKRSEEDKTKKSFNLTLGAKLETSQITFINFSSNGSLNTPNFNIKILKDKKNSVNPIESTVDLQSEIDKIESTDDDDEEDDSFVKSVNNEEEIYYKSYKNKDSDVTLTINGQTNNEGELVLSTITPEKKILNKEEQSPEVGNNTVLVAIHSGPNSGSSMPEYVIHGADGSNYKYEIISVIDLPLANSTKTSEQIEVEEETTYLDYTAEKDEDLFSHPDEWIGKPSSIPIENNINIHNYEKESKRVPPRDRFSALTAQRDGEKIDKKSQQRLRSTGITIIDSINERELNDAITLEDLKRNRLESHNQNKLSNEAIGSSSVDEYQYDKDNNMISGEYSASNRVQEKTNQGTSVGTNHNSYIITIILSTSSIWVKFFMHLYR